MSRFKIDLLSPYISDVAAFAVLVVSIATILGVAGMKAETHQASFYHTTSYGVTSL